MRLCRLPTTIAALVILLVVGQTEAIADAYDSAIQQAERLWREGQKTEAVQLYASVWRQKPDDVERQILYGERSAEAGLSRWALNFLRVAELNARNNQDHLRKVYAGYAKVYNDLGRPDLAQSYQEKAKGGGPPTRDVVAAPVTTPRTYYFGYYTELPPGGGVGAISSPAKPPAVPKRQTRSLRKRVAVATIGAALERSDLGRYTSQVRAALVEALRRSGEFSVVRDPALADRLLASSEDVSGAGGNGRDLSRSAVERVDVLVRGEITEFTNLAPGSRHFGIGPLSIDSGRSRVRLGMTVWIHGGFGRNLVASENVSVEKAAESAGGGFSISLSDDWDLHNSILGPATDELVLEAVATIVAGAESIPWQAHVIRATGNEVEIDMGSDEGVRTGDRFRVIGFGEQGRGRGGGRGNGRGLGNEKGRGAKERDVGEIEITRVDFSTAVGRVLRKDGPFDGGARVVPLNLSAVDR